jgi:predicted restriction endonuclease
LDTLKITKEINEFDLEQILAMHDTPSFLKIEKTIKIRKLDRKIIDRLKQIYHYRCQICGQYIGEKYDAEIIHSHHIDYFSTSLNNNANNILIVCPNHHGIIHTTNPQFDRNTKQFIYPNGYKEDLELNVHL